MLMAALQYGGSLAIFFTAIIVIILRRISVYLIILITIEVILFQFYSYCNILLNFDCITLVQMSKTYAIVKFLDENSIEFIPKSWMMGRTSAFWPANNANRFRQDMIEPDATNELWVCYDIKFYKYAGMYIYYIQRDAKCIQLHISLYVDSETEARRLTRLLEEASELESEVEGSRRPAKKRSFDDYEEVYIIFTFSAVIVRFIPSFPLTE